MRKYFLFFLMSTSFILLAIITGCSGGKSTTDPITSQSSFEKTGPGNPDALPIIAFDGETGIGVMGVYNLTISDDFKTAELTPMRTSAIGESYIVSGLSFFTISPCSDCLKIKEYKLSGGDLTLTFGIKHPFKPGDPSKLPSAINRLDLDVFDLALVIEPTTGVPDNYPLIGVSTFANVVSNSSGYTRELSNVIGVQAALPYVLVIDDSETGAGTWNKFAMGANKEFDVVFKMTPGTPMRFDMYLTMGYGASAKKPGRLAPKYYNPEFNRKAAWKVEVTSSGVWVDNDNTTPVDVEVKVYDWQIGATVYGTPADFANAPANNIYAASEVSNVSVEIPGMTSTLPMVNTPDSGLGAPSDPLIFTVPVANQNLLPAGDYVGLVKVLDERLCLTVPDGRDIIIDTPDGILLNNYAMPEYATYQVFDATVTVGPTGKLTWAKRAGGTGNDAGRAITTLSDNSTVVTGYFYNSATFGPGEQNQIVLTTAGGSDIFIARYNPDGTLAWAKRAGGSSDDRGWGITTLSDNSTVVTGSFGGSTTFGPGELNQTVLTSAGLVDIFIARYNPNGTLAWAKRAGGGSNESGNGITALSDNSTVVTGYFEGSATFGQSELNQTVLTSAGASDIFIAHYNPDGTLAWAKRAGGTSGDAGFGITTLLDNSTVVTGQFGYPAGASATFGPSEPNQTILTSAGEADIFIARYNPDGTLAWAKRAGGGGSSRDVGHGITTLSDNSTVVTGYFGYSGNTATFGPGEPNQTILTSAGIDDIFIAGYNPDGTLSWAKRAGGSGSDVGVGITTLSDNSTVVTGYFGYPGGSATFGPGEPNQTVLTWTGGDDIFVARYNPDGTLSWAKRVGGSGSDTGFAITTLSDNSTVATGDFGNVGVSATFGLGEPNQTVLTSAGGYDIFVARFAP